MPANKNNNNPRNPDSPLYKRLTRLFSGPLINYRSQNTRQLRRRQLDKYSKTFNDVAGQKFKRLSYNPYDNLSSYQMQAQSRLQRYADFDQMEYTPEIASALDIYADEMTTHSGLQPGVERCVNMETFFFTWTLIPIWASSKSLDCLATRFKDWKGKTRQIPIMYSFSGIARA